MLCRKGAYVVLAVPSFPDGDIMMTAVPSSAEVFLPGHDASLCSVASSEEKNALHPQSAQSSGGKESLVVLSLRTSFGRLGDKR